MRTKENVGPSIDHEVKHTQPSGGNGHASKRRRGGCNSLDIAQLGHIRAASFAQLVLRWTFGAEHLTHHAVSHARNGDRRALRLDSCAQDEGWGSNDTACQLLAARLVCNRRVLYVYIEVHTRTLV